MNENMEEAGRRRLIEEMGFDTEIIKIFDFIYKAQMNDGLTEHELDHVLFGRFNGEPVINPEEVAMWKWADMVEIEKDIAQKPEKYTIWFKIAFDRVNTFLKSKKE
jgi:isopentenyl-diphosphate delta-isomerase